MEAYLGQLLGADRRFRPLNWERYSRLSPTCRRDTILYVLSAFHGYPLANKPNVGTYQHESKSPRHFTISGFDRNFLFKFENDALPIRT